MINNQKSLVLEIKANEPILYFSSGLIKVANPQIKACKRNKIVKK